MKYLLIFFLLVVIQATGLFAQNSESPAFDSAYAAKLGADAYGNCAYTFVMLTSGDAVIADKKVRDSLFAGHMANMGEMVAAEKLVLAGPFLKKNEADFRGIFILNTTDTSEVIKLLSLDPAISNGLLKATQFPWYGSAALKEVNVIHQKVQKSDF